MDSTERLIELQVGFAKKQTAIAIALLIFMGVNFLLQPEVAISVYLTTTLGFGVVLLDVLFFRKDNISNSCCISSGCWLIFTAISLVPLLQITR